jgi:hypothetical protein
MMSIAIASGILMRVSLGRRAADIFSLIKCHELGGATRAG